MADYLADVKKYDAGGQCRRGRQDRQASGHCAAQSRFGAGILHGFQGTRSCKGELGRQEARHRRTAAKADSAIEKICKAMAADNTKSRVTFYYLVAKDLGKLGSL